MPTKGEYLQYRDFIRGERYCAVKSIKPKLPFLSFLSGKTPRSHTYGALSSASIELGRLEASHETTPSQLDRKIGRRFQCPYWGEVPNRGILVWPGPNMEGCRFGTTRICDMLILF